MTEDALIVQARALLDLCRGKVEGRTSAEEITLFKSVGTALEDFAAAMRVWRRLEGAR